MKKKNSDTNRTGMYKALLALKTEEEAVAFMEDLCSINELKSMEQRYQVAELLNEGRIYKDILETTGASSATISRVNRSLQYGTGGYELIFDRLAGCDED